jgi:broad specificity phosphatase PhoE
MRIGLIRHFPVELRFPTGWKTAADLHSWRQEYEASPVILGQAEMGSFKWDQCISSDIERAIATAKAVFSGPVEHTMLLREPDFSPFGTGNLRLPVWIWRWILQFSWFTGHRSQRACRNDFRRRVAGVADLLETKEGDTLVVSHAVMMAYLSAEIRRRGFAGPRLRIAKHATLYVYEKQPQPSLAVTSEAERQNPGEHAGTREAAR